MGEVFSSALFFIWTKTVSKDQAPLMLYTYENERDDICSLVIRDDLETVPNPLSCDPALYAPRTPETVRTLYYNKIARITPKPNEAPALMAEFIRLHIMPDESMFLEVRLTKAGLEFLKDFHFDMGGFGFHSQPVCDYREYNPIEKLSRQWYKNLFTSRLRDALTFLGLNPKL